MIVMMIVWYTYIFKLIKWKLNDLYWNSMFLFWWKNICGFLIFFSEITAKVLRNITEICTYGSKANV